MSDPEQRKGKEEMSIFDSSPLRELIVQSSVFPQDGDVLVRIAPWRKTNKGARSRGVCFWLQFDSITSENAATNCWWVS